MAGIYIHIPFCKQKCTYCDFHFSTTFRPYQQEMIDAMLREIGLRKQELEGERISTIYFGGGTPSLLPAEQLNALLGTIRDTFDCVEAPECTLEANPDDITEAKVQEWKAAGINRLSVGIQSFDEMDLRWMNRAHSAEQGLDCIHIAQAGGITNISLDLMYGLPEMDNDRWLKQIRQAIALDVTHISAYCLTVETKTALHKLVQQQKIVPASNEAQGEQFELLVSTLKAAGIHQYEISNFAKEGFISQHNSNYWRGVPYLGIGPSAHSFDGKSRSWNIASNKEYIRRINAGESWLETELLTGKDQFNELLLTGLRTIWGVDLVQLGKLHQLSAAFEKTLEEYSTKGWITANGNQLVLTEAGKLWADAIAQDLFVS